MTSPKDIARWAFWVPFRSALDPQRPDQLRRLYPLWRAQHALAKGQRARIEQELVLRFGDARPDRIQDCYRIAFRVHAEELLLGKLSAETVGNYMQFQGREHLDDALAHGKGAIICQPHAGNVMMMIALLSLHGYDYTQYAARGLAPTDVAQAHPDTFGHNRWREQARAAREANEDKLPARFLTLDTSARELYRRLGDNGLVGITYDGRIGSKFVGVDYLGSRALLNPGAFRLAARTGATLLPVFNACPADGVNRCVVQPGLRGTDWRELMVRFLRDHAEPWLRENPAHYGVWLAHCRERAGVDDHPLFVDYAPDDRYTRWPDL
jgi:lauroyl/myristoyl acyltransferase